MEWHQIVRKNSWSPEDDSLTYLLAPIGRSKFSLALSNILGTKMFHGSQRLMLKNLCALTLVLVPAFGIVSEKS